MPPHPEGGIPTGSSTGGMGGTGGTAVSPLCYSFHLMLFPCIPVGPVLQDKPAPVQVFSPGCRGIPAPGLQPPPPGPAAPRAFSHIFPSHFSPQHFTLSLREFHTGTTSCVCPTAGLFQSRPEPARTSRNRPCLAQGSPALSSQRPPCRPAASTPHGNPLRLLITSAHKCLHNSFYIACSLKTEKYLNSLKLFPKILNFSLVLLFLRLIYHEEIH